MATRTYETTNEKLDKVCGMVSELISWANADAEHAAENDAPETSHDDRTRAASLSIALSWLKTCRR